MSYTMRLPQPSAATRRFTTREKLALAAEVTVTYIRVRLWLRREQVAQVVEQARASANHSAAEPSSETMWFSLRLGRIVERGLSHLPGDTRCLTRSIVLIRLLSLRGIETKLVIGVKPQPFEAHAWVEYEGQPLLSPIEYDAGRLIEI